MVAHRGRRQEIVAVMFGAILVVAAGPRPGVPPDGPWACPDSHPIKGYVSEESGRRIYFMPGTRFYEEASPERCYASETEARRDGSRPERESAPSVRTDRLI